MASAEVLAKEETNKDDLTKGIIWKQLMRFFFPILIGTFFQQLYNTVDALVVGRFAGKIALSAVGGSSAQILNLIVGFFTGLSSGCSVVISQMYGAKDQAGLKKALQTAYAFSILGGIVLGALGYALSPTLFRLMDTPEEMMASSVLYIRIYFIGLIFVFIYNMGSAILRALGDSKRPLYYLIACCIVNIVLDLLFVCVFKMDVAGAAWATLIAQAISSVLVTRSFMGRNAELRLRLKEIRVHMPTLRLMLRIGLPGGLQSCMYNISNVLIQASINGFGVDTVAAWTAIGKIDCIFWMINQAFGITVTTYVGQNFGAGKYERIKKGVRTCIVIEFIISVLISLMLCTLGDWLLGFFVTDVNVIDIGVRMLLEITPAYAVFVFVEMFSGTLRAENHVAVPTLITVVGICVVRLVWIYGVFPKGTMEQVIFCYPVTWVLSAILMSIYYIHKQKRIIPQI